MATYPGLMTRQQMAVGGPIKRRKPAEEVGLKAYLQGMAPIARAEKHREKLYDQWLAEQERGAEEHATAMEVQREEVAASQEAAEEEQKIAREGLVLGRKAQRETEKQAKRGLGLQAVSTALQAYPLIFGDQPVTTSPYPTTGWQSDEDEYGGRGSSAEVSYSVGFDCTCMTFLYGLFSPQVRYAKVFCGRFMDLATLLGYYQIAAKIIRILKRYPVLSWPMRKCLAGPFYNFMLWKLGRRKKVSIPTRLWVKFFLWVCKRQEDHRKRVMILPHSFKKCINAVKGR